MRLTLLLVALSMLLLVPAQANDESTVVGHGVTYGPRESRHELTVWDDCGTFTLRLRVYGAPLDDIHSTGNIEQEVETVLPKEAYEFLMDQLSEPDECEVSDE